MLPHKIKTTELVRQQRAYRQVLWYIPTYFSLTNFPDCFEHATFLFKILLCIIFDKLSKNDVLKHVSPVPFIQWFIAVLIISQIRVKKNDTFWLMLKACIALCSLDLRIINYIIDHETANFVFIWNIDIFHFVCQR